MKYFSLFLASALFVFLPLNAQKNKKATLQKLDTQSEKYGDIAMQIWALNHGYITLNQHEISNRIAWNNWKERALQAIRLHVYALVATQ
jgi:hypothetical protein